MELLFEFVRSLRRVPRSLLRTPAITVASIAALAIALGATTAIFSVLYGVVLRPLPFRDPTALVQINARAEDGRLLGMSQVELADWVSHSSSFESVALYGFNQFTLTGAGDPSLLRGAIVSKQFFSLLSVPTRLGRTLGDEDDGAPHIVLAERTWRGRFGGDPGVIGRAVTLNGKPYTVVGVASDTLRFPAEDIELWTTLGYALTMAPPQWNMRGFRQFSIIARLRPSVTLAAARSDAAQVAASLAETYPRFNAKVGVAVTPLQERLAGRVRPTLVMLFGAVVLVLLVACGNLANLSFARAADRQREIAIRAATGASQGQLVAHALAESVVLAVAGAALGLMVAAASLAAMLRFLPAEAPRASDIRLDFMPIAFTFAAAVIAVLLFGVAPAMWGARRPASDALRQSRHSHRGLAVWRDGLVVAEIALAVVLLVGSALLGRTLFNLIDSGSGAGNGGAMTVQLSLPLNVSGGRFIDRLLAELRTMPEVTAAGVTSSVPPNVSQMRTSLPALTTNGAERDVTVEVVAASGGVFDALGVRLLSGRTFTDADTADSMPVVILSQKASDWFFPNHDAIGQGLRAFASGRDRKAPVVIGVVDDLKFAGLDAEPDGALYMPYTQRSFRTQYLVVSAKSSAAWLMPQIREAIRKIDPSLAVSEVRSLHALIDAAAAQPRFQASVLVLFAVLATALAGVGLYGLMTHVVAQRSPELAIRMALGATRSGVLAMVMAKALRLVAVGAGIGVVLAYFSAGAIAGLLFGVAPVDVASFAGAVLFAFVIGAAAAWSPARRATSVEPAITLRAS